MRVVLSPEESRLVADAVHHDVSLEPDLADGERAYLADALRRYAVFVADARDPADADLLARIGALADQLAAPDPAA